LVSLNAPRESGKFLLIRIPCEIGIRVTKFCPLHPCYVFCSDAFFRFSDVIGSPFDLTGELLFLHRFLLVLLRYVFTCSTLIVGDGVSFGVSISDDKDKERNSVVATRILSLGKGNVRMDLETHIEVEGT
jgi:hypothetical protein